MKIVLIFNIDSVQFLNLIYKKIDQLIDHLNKSSDPLNKRLDSWEQMMSVKDKS